MTRVAIVHDYLTQRGGAERVVLSMLKAFPGAPLYTSLYWPDGTFPEFRDANVRCLSLDRFLPFQRHHRLAAPFLAMAFSKLTLDADVVLCSSSGWSHGVSATGRKIVYCYAPAHWLYQGDRYLGARRPVARIMLHAARPFLRRWDERAAHSAQRYLTQSTAARDAIRRVYGIEAEVLPGPLTLGVGNGVPVDGVEPGFFLCVSRLLPYKNIDAVVSAFAKLANARLILVGTGPEQKRVQREAPRNVRLLGRVSDQELRWLYANSAGLIAASFEDYGLTPLEAAAHGKPTVALRWGGYLDTVIEGTTGIFCEAPTVEAIREAVIGLANHSFSPAAIRAHAALYSEDAFIARLRAIVSGHGEQAPRALAQVS